MSIAVSAVVRPSVCLRLLSAGLAVCALAAGVALAGGGYRLGLLGAGASVLGGLLCLVFPGQATKPQQIDISGVGQIRLTVYLGMAGGSARTVGLVPGSTLWPGLLLLRLRGEDGAVLALPLWPGNVAGAAFRPLAVACRLIAARPGEME
jgi:toxin CptA